MFRLSAIGASHCDTHKLLGDGEREAVTEKEWARRGWPKKTGPYGRLKITDTLRSGDICPSGPNAGPAALHLSSLDLRGRL